MKYSYENEQEDSLTFEDGIVCTSTYSYKISSWGYLELNKDATKKLYQAMKEYYEDLKNE